MDCGEFLRGLSDFRDGLVRDRTAVARYEDHQRSCARCSRLLVALDMGLDTLRDREAPEPSAGFRLSLERRLRAEVAIGDPVMPTHAGLAAAFMMAAALGLLVYEGVSRQGSNRAASAATAAPATFPDLVRRPPPLQDVTLPAFTNTELQYHGQQRALGTFAGLTY
jgi:hypothetical protein